jgi:hypothetical protein
METWVMVALSLEPKVSKQLDLKSYRLIKGKAVVALEVAPLSLEVCATVVSELKVGNPIGDSISLL